MTLFKGGVQAVTSEAGEQVLQTEKQTGPERQREREIRQLDRSDRDGVREVQRERYREIKRERKERKRP